MTAVVLKSHVTVSQRVAVGLASLLLGIFMVYGVGFAGSERLHATAHDTRHAIGFPCH